MDSVCKNCDRDLTPQFTFCPDCGQKANLHRLNIHDIFHEAIHYFTHADKGIFQLIRDLTVRPGSVAREYVEGRRRHYFPPLNFFLIIAAILVISSSWNPTKTSDISQQNIEQLSKIKDPQERAEQLQVYERKAKVSPFVSKYSNLFALASLPLSAFVFFVFYARSRYNYIEHLVAGMYMIGFCLLIYALLVAAANAIGIKRDYVSGILLLFQIGYGAFFYFGFMEKNRKRRIFLPLAASFTSVFMWILLTTSLIGFYIRSGFWGLMP